MIRFAQFRERYGAKVLLGAAILVAIIVPPETRNAAWGWLLKGLNVMDVIVIVGGFRLMSNVEHRKTFMKITGIGDKLDNGVKARLDAIEEQVSKLRSGAK